MNLYTYTHTHVHTQRSSVLDHSRVIVEQVNVVDQMLCTLRMLIL